MKAVCKECILDEDIAAHIDQNGEPANCSFCDRQEIQCLDVDDLASFMSDKLSNYYSKAVDSLPYETREGGFQAWTSDTYDLLMDEVALSYSDETDGEGLTSDLVDAIGDDTWCEYDWLVLDVDESLAFDWKRFCDVIKHRRRFFFQKIGEPTSSFDHDSRSLGDFLGDLCSSISTLNLIQTREVPYRLYRARTRNAGEKFETAADLGPPPEDMSLQSNRMNPPGIPMFYGSEAEKTAIEEIRSTRASLATFVNTRPLRILDLKDVSQTPGMFSNVSRTNRLTLKFLHEFSKLITTPVDGTDRTHLDYIPTQVLTEYLRDFAFAGGNIDGMRYSSALSQTDSNVVIFASQENIEGCGNKSVIAPPDIMLQLEEVRHIE